MYKFGTFAILAVLSWSAIGCGSGESRNNMSAPPESGSSVPPEADVPMSPESDPSAPPE